MRYRQSAVVVVIVGTVAWLTASCAPMMHVRTDYSRGAGFATIHTFSIRQGNSTGWPELDQQIESDVTAALLGKGWQRVPTGEGDVVVVENTATRTKHTYGAFYDRGNWQWQGGRPPDDEFTSGTIVVDIFNARTKEVMWRGVARGVILIDKDPIRHAMDNSMRIDDAVPQLFEHFPPA